MKNLNVFPTGFFAVLILITACRQKEEKRIHHTVFRLGFKTESFSTGPLINSGFIFKLNDSTPPVFLTAHHVVAGYDGGKKYYEWFELNEKVKNAWLWSMEDSGCQLKLGENIPIPGAKTLQLDLAAFRIPARDDLGYLKPGFNAARVGDTVQLFSKLIFEGPSTSILNPGRVIYVTDSVLVYEFLILKLVRMSGTSGSAVLNKNNELVANSYGGLALPDQQEIEKIAKDFPLIKKLNVEVGKSYGIGVPVRLIQASFSNAIKAQKATRN